MSGDFSPTSPLWANEDVVSPWDAADITKTTSMKNPGWFSVPNRVIRMCYSGPRSDCATFTHNRGLTLTQLFATQFAVEVQEEYTFETLMKKLGKHLDLGHLKTVSKSNQNHIRQTGKLCLFLNYAVLNFLFALGLQGIFKRKILS